MNTTTSHRAGRVVRALAVASTAAGILAAAACGSQTGSDGGTPAAPPPMQAHLSAPPPVTAGISAEPWHELKLRRSHPVA